MPDITRLAAGLADVRSCKEQEAILGFFEDNPAIETIDAFVVDVNGVLRGKTLPRKSAAKIFKSGLRLPRSAFAVDAWGHDVPAAGLVLETGDNDGICRPVPDSLFVSPWATRPRAQVLMSMEDADGAAFFGDPRYVLANVLAEYAARGLTPVVALEMEFYLFDATPDSRGFPRPPASPRTGRRSLATQNYGLGEVAEFRKILQAIGDACKVQGIVFEALISESGPGQYEINFHHQPNALRAADQATLFKRLVRGTARKFGQDATFMAKPYADFSGNGMHTHVSVVDAAGKNIFAQDKTDAEEAPILRHALGGLLATMRDATAVFAPNINAYRRFCKGAHAPTGIAWGRDNRTAALRVPQSEPAEARIEHRVSGTDANPYLMLAAILAGILHGIDNKIEPGTPATGNVYEADVERLPETWGEALTVFEKSDFMASCLGAAYKNLYLACKRQEQEELARQVTSAEYDAYLRDI